MATKKGKKKPKAHRTNGKSHHQKGTSHHQAVVPKITDGNSIATKLAGISDFDLGRQRPQQTPKRR